MSFLCGRASLLLLIFLPGLLPGLLLTLLPISLVRAAGPSLPGPDARRPGADFMSASTRAMQADDSRNPGMLWVRDGEALWNTRVGATGLSCAACHGKAETAMRGAAARYPAFDARAGRPVDLGQRINQCRVQHQKAEPLRHESQELLSLESWVALQSRGMPIAPPDDARLDPYRQRGAQRFTQRMGQLNLSCAQCHDDLSGRRLGSSQIPQAHPEGYPVYRLEWQGMGSLQRRLRNCMNGVRAEPFAFDALEMTELELYLALRAKGMALSSPAVRP